MELPVDHFPAESSGTPVVILHGLFGSKRNWRSIATRLAAAGHDTYCLDLRNHGEAAWADPVGDGLLAAMADDVTETMAADGVGAYALIGHSMGGKVAMLAALRGESAIERLVVVDVSPVAYPPAFSAYVAAMLNADLDGVTSRREVDEHLAATVDSAGTRAFLLQNLIIDSDGARWRPNLAALGPDLPAITGWPADIDGTYDRPTLVISGGRSNYVTAEHTAAFAEYFPHAEFEIVSEAGHWVHVEVADAFIERVEAFLG